MEIYDERRFFAMTGKAAGGRIESRQAEVIALHGQFWPAPEPNGRPRASTRPLDLDDAELIDRMFAASNGSEIRALWDGSTNGHHGDDSATDLAFANHLAFWTQHNAEQMDRLFRQSGLMREKWDSPRGDSTYGAWTIAKAISGTPNDYQPGYEQPTFSTESGPSEGPPEAEPSEDPPDWLVGSPMDPCAVASDPLPPLPGFPFLHAGMGAVISGPSGKGRSSAVIACAYDAACEGLRVLYLGSEVTEDEFNARARLLMDKREDDSEDVRSHLARVRYLDLRETLARAHGSPAEWLAGVGPHYDVIIIDPLNDALSVVRDRRNRAEGIEYVEFYGSLIEPLRAHGTAVLMLDNVGHADDAKDRPLGTSAKMHKADLLFSCSALEDPPRLQIVATKVRSVRAAFKNGMAWVIDDATQTVAATGPFVAYNGEDPKAEAVAAVLSDQPQSERDVAAASGVPRSTAQRKLTALEAVERASKTTAGWVGGPLAHSLGVE